MKLFLSRQYLDDICRHFMPYMIMVMESKLKGTDPENKAYTLVCLSVLEDLDTMFQRKTLTRQFKFNIRLKKAEAVILWQLMMKFPLVNEDFWRITLRQNIVEQLYQQLQKELV